jgi:hypothetical protein
VKGRSPGGPDEDDLPGPWEAVGWRHDPNLLPVPEEGAHAGPPGHEAHRPALAKTFAHGFTEGGVQAQ